MSFSVTKTNLSVHEDKNKATYVKVSGISELQLREGIEDNSSYFSKNSYFFTHPLEQSRGDGSEEGSQDTCYFGQVQGRGYLG